MRLINTHSINVSKPFILAGLITCGFLTPLPAMAETDTPTYSGGLSLGIFGLGLNLSKKTDLSFTDSDQIQWRVGINGLEIDNVDDVDLSDIDYNDTDISMLTLQAGIDWFPYSQGWAEEIFFSTGLLYSDFNISGNADLSKNFSVGGQTVTSGDINSLESEIDDAQILPYISFGWGNKISGKPGFDFQTEVGMAIPTRHADANVSVSDPGNFLSAASIAKEEQELEDDVFDGIRGFVSASVSYQF